LFEDKNETEARIVISMDKGTTSFKSFFEEITTGDPPKGGRSDRGQPVGDVEADALHY
jgi:hypothetical protein